MLTDAGKISTLRDAGKRSNIKVWVDPLSTSDVVGASLRDVWKLDGRRSILSPKGEHGWRLGGDHYLGDNHYFGELEIGHSE